MENVKCLVVGAGFFGSVIAEQIAEDLVAGGDPYYSVNTMKEKELLSKYHQGALALNNVIFGGILAEYE
jgi:UDP-galactopyranose mutase